MQQAFVSLLVLLAVAFNCCLARPETKSQSEDVAKAEDGAIGPNWDTKKPQQSPPQFPDLPPQLEKILPADVVQKLKAIHTDPTLSFLQKQESIDKIMTGLPTETLDKIPPPPGFDKLPEEVRNKLKQIHRSKDKSWAQKQQELQAYIQSLPADQRAILMMGPGGPPPPSMGAPPPNFGRR